MEIKTNLYTLYRCRSAVIRPFVASDRIAAHNLHTFELVDLFLSSRHCRVRYSKKIMIFYNSEIIELLK